MLQRKLFVGRINLIMVPTAPRKKRTLLALSEQAEAACLLRSGAPAAHLMQIFKISRRAVKNIKKKVERILQIADNDARSSKTKTVLHAQFPLIEKEVY